MTPDVNHSDKASVSALLLYFISAHNVMPWFLLSLTMDSLFLYVIKQVQMGHLPFTTTYSIKWWGLITTAMQALTEISSQGSGLTNWVCG